MREIVKRIWRGEYKDISFEIVHWKYAEGEDSGIWNYYVYMKKQFLSSDLWEELWGIGQDDLYQTSTVVDNIPIHGGITYFGRDIDYQMIKIGCDYNHDMDSGKRYDEKIIYMDVEQTIDYIREKIYNK
jgi:hypothetical protein